MSMRVDTYICMNVQEYEHDGLILLKMPHSSACAYCLVKVGNLIIALEAMYYVMFSN